jgi:hypothetical protein
MTTSTYDPCLLITTTTGAFRLVGIQTDNTLFIADNEFATKEDTELGKAKFMAKPKEKLMPENPLSFNSYILSQDDVNMLLIQKGQGKKIKIIDANLPDFRQSYVKQRARGAYIALLCQPEAAFDLLVAAQHQEPATEDVTTLNKRLAWQLSNLNRRLLYIPLDLAIAKLFVFVDSLFANNKDLSSQIGYEIILANKTTRNKEFLINRNLIH